MHQPRMLEPVRVTAPSADPIAVAEAKVQARVAAAVTEDDAYLDGLISAATHFLGGWTGKLGGVVLMSETWRASFDAFPGKRRLNLPLVPVQSITSVVYADASNADQTLAASKYALHEDERGAFLWLDAAQSAWPDTYDDRPDAVRVTMLCGYGNASDVPQEARQAIKALVAHWYEHREVVVMGAAPAQVPVMFEDMIADLRRPSFG